MYILTNKNEKSDIHKKLEKRENYSIFDEESSIEMLDETLSGILMDMKRNNLIQESSIIAGLIKKEVGKRIYKKKKVKIKKANFRVLKNLTSPSILLELGYITNSRNRKILNSPKKLSNSIAKAITNYFSHINLQSTSPINSFSSDEKKQIEKSYNFLKIIKVKKGDTLRKISRKYHVSVRDLIKTNKIENPNSLKINTSIIIP
jgi:N-acetylmuramoyl-L-alanine amidase